ncbi:hypothetical protein HDU76_001573 [Blyttiomyces sp. JEL0837]|nr:hypothetical protein HDU76_001573 [Blyttiomyces sp. JEL0837]
MSLRAGRKKVEANKIHDDDVDPSLTINEKAFKATTLDIDNNDPDINLHSSNVTLVQGSSGGQRGKEEHSIKQQHSTTSPSSSNTPTPCISTATTPRASTYTSQDIPPVTVTEGISTTTPLHIPTPTPMHQQIIKQDESQSQSLSISHSHSSDINSPATLDRRHHRFSILSASSSSSSSSNTDSILEDSSETDGVTVITSPGMSVDVDADDRKDGGSDENDGGGRRLTVSGVFRLSIVDDTGRGLGVVDVVNDEKNEYDDEVTSPVSPIGDGNGDVESGELNRLRTLQKRERIARELLSTEADYLDALNFLRATFLRKFQEKVGTSGEILCQKSIRDIFANLEDIIGMSTELYERLRERIESPNWDPERTCLGDIWAKRGPFLKIYSSYYANFTTALSVISDEMGKNPTFAAFLKNAARLPECKSLRFDAFLIMPVQRIPRYEMLMKSLLDKTVTSHPDYEALKKSVKIISDVAASMNEKVRQHEMFRDMLNIQRSMIGFNEVLLVPGRTLIHHGLVTKICRRTDQVRKLFLFNDVLIYTRPHLRNMISEDSSVVFHRKIYLDRCRVVNSPDVGAIQNSFQIVSPEKSFALYVESPASKDKWISLLTGAIEELHRNKSTLRTDGQKDKSSYSAPVWIPDKYSPTCMSCNVEFSMWRRKCFIIPAYKDRPEQAARACDTCYDAMAADKTFRVVSTSPAPVSASDDTTTDSSSYQYTSSVLSSSQSEIREHQLTSRSRNRGTVKSVDSIASSSSSTLSSFASNFLFPDRRWSSSVGGGGRAESPSGVDADDGEQGELESSDLATAVDASFDSGRMRRGSAGNVGYRRTRGGSISGALGGDGRVQTGRLRMMVMYSSSNRKRFNAEEATLTRDVAIECGVGTESARIVDD